MLSLYQLEIFTLVADVGKISSAAEQLYISQSAVSQHIREFELSLGVSLFERSRRGVTLTPAGLVLYDYAKDILRLVAEAENAVTNVHNLSSGQITIGGTPTMAVYVLPEWMRDFREQYPNLTSTVHTGVTEQIIDDVLNRRIDIGFVEGELDEKPHEKLGSLVLQEIPQMLIVGQNHPWWETSAIHATDLHQQHFVMRQPNSKTRVWIEDMLRQHGAEPKITGAFDNPESIKHAVISGTCLSVLPAYAVQRELEMGLLRSLTITDVELSRSLKLIWDKSRLFTPVTTAFLKYQSQQFPQIRHILHPTKEKRGGI